MSQWTDLRLQRAAETDDTSALYALIKENAKILEGFDEMPFVETPLHIAAAKGNIKFAMQMVNLKPSFARKLDQSLRTPLHLAVEKGDTRMALRLLKTDVDLLRLKGIDGKTPFHLAVEGNLDLLVEFLKSCPDECVKDLTIDGSNALHLAMRKDRLGAAVMLTVWVYRHLGNLKSTKETLNARDANGDTPLHIAAKKNLVEIIRVLTRLPKVDKNLKNHEGKTALDILKEEQGGSLSHQRDNIVKAIDILQRAGGSTASSLGKEKPLSKCLRSVVSSPSIFSKAIVRSRKSFTDDQSNAMLVVSVLVITIAFQGVLSPPGGVFQASSDDSSNTNSKVTSPTHSINSEDKNKRSTSPQKSPGKSVMPEDKFLQYWLFNTLALMTAFAVTIYFLPPGLVAFLFVVIVSLLLHCYQVSISIISPVPGLDTYSLVITCVTYGLLSLYIVVWHRISYYWFWYFWKIIVTYAVKDLFGYVKDRFTDNVTE